MKVVTALMCQSALKSQLMIRVEMDLQDGAFTAVHSFDRQMSAAALWKGRHVRGCQIPVCVLPLCVGHLSLWQIWLSSRRPPTVNSNACSSLPSTLWSHLTTPASLPGKKPQLAPLPACFSSSSSLQILWEAWGILCTQLRWTDNLGTGPNPVK